MSHLNFRKSAIYLHRAEPFIRLPESHLHVLDVLRLVELEGQRAVTSVCHEPLGARPPGLGVLDVAVPGQLGQTPVVHAAVVARRGAGARVVAVRAGCDGRKGSSLDETVDARGAGVEASGTLVAAARASEDVGGAGAGAAVAVVVTWG